MIEAKFRGKCKNNDKIVTGNLFKLPNACFIIKSTTFMTKKDDPKHFSIFWDQTKDYPSQTAIMVYPVYPESIAQFVGYDKNGEEVFSDDRVFDLNGNERIVADILVNFNSIGGHFNNVILKEN